MTSVVLDTSVLIALERGQNIESLALKKAKRFLLPTIVIAEFLQAAHKATAPEKLLDQRETFLRNISSVVSIVDFDEASSRVYAKLWALVSDAGKPKSVIDLQLAAVAKRHTAEVVSLDSRADFDWLMNLLD